jgi:hypothetical protein
MGAGGAAALGAGAGLLGGMVLADAMTPDVVQNTNVYEGGDSGGGGGGYEEGDGDYGGGDEFCGGDFDDF